MLTTAPPFPAAPPGDLDAGVVDQDVEAAEFVDSRFDRGLPARVVGDVEFDGSHFAVIAERFRGLRALILLDIADHHGRAGLGQTFGDRRADPLRAAGDQRLAAGQIELTHPRFLPDHRRPFGHSFQRDDLCHTGRRKQSGAEGVLRS